MGAKLALCEEVYSYFGLYLEISAFSGLLSDCLRHPKLYMGIFHFFTFSSEIFYLQCISIIEYAIELYLFPAVKSLYPMIYVGIAMAVGGEILWCAALIVAAKFRGYALLSSALYSLFRHPAYMAYILSHVGLQLLLCNPLSIVAYVWLYWRHYSEWIPYEEVCM